jgi:thiamine biosynthesis lipoprotein
MDQKKQNMRKKICTALIIATLLVILTYVYRNYFSNHEPIAKSGFYFNTIIAIQLNDSTDESLIDDCFELADTYEHYFSRTLEGSDIYQINHAGGDWVTVHNETLELIQAGISYGEMSDGMFDITIGALTELWNIPDNDGVIPAETDIQAAAATVDYRQIQINGNQVSLSNPDAKLDLGGIAKGYAADAMKSYLNENGVTEGFINLGGNVLTLGEKKDGESYRIGIRRPFGEENDAITTVEVSDKSVVTSGSYERYFEKDGRIYHHILDPVSGYPYDNDLNAVTIISDSSMEGDALSTICFALGKEKGMELIDSMPDISAIFIDRDNQLYESSSD